VTKYIPEILNYFALQVNSKEAQVIRYEIGGCDEPNMEVLTIAVIISKLDLQHSSPTLSLILAGKIYSSIPVNT
jgi:hypothetical protein